MGFLRHISVDENGVSQVVLCSPRWASARISLLGGQVRSWKTERGEQLLFTSSKKFSICSPVRGGIPICFPKFGEQVSAELHGFVRNRMWVIDENPALLQSTDSSTGNAFIDLVYKSTDDDLRFWPHRFELRLRVILGVDGSLTLISRVRNVDCKPFSFSFAYHTYFSVSDISEVRVEGLENLDYLDSLLHRERFTEQQDAITFESEVDRVYVSTSDTVRVFDHEKERTFVIKKEGLPDVVVWNPWEKKSKTMIDFGNDEYKHMLCVDAAAIENPVTLKPWEEWTGRVELSITSSL